MSGSAATTAPTHDRESRLTAASGDMPRPLPPNLVVARASTFPAHYMPVFIDESPGKRRLQIESRLHERAGKTITNFPATLPPEDSDRATLLIAATAIEHGLTVVTRNVRYFEPPGVRRACISPVAVKCRCGRLRRSLRRQPTKGRVLQAMRLAQLGFVYLPRTSLSQGIQPSNCCCDSDVFAVAVSCVGRVATNRIVLF